MSWSLQMHPVIYLRAGEAPPPSHLGARDFVSLGQLVELRPAQLQALGDLIQGRLDARPIGSLHGGPSTAQSGIGEGTA